jgi:hypothetical protein
MLFLAVRLVPLVFELKYLKKTRKGPVKSDPLKLCAVVRLSLVPPLIGDVL